MSNNIGMTIRGDSGQLQAELAKAGSAVQNFGNTAEKYLQKGELSAKQLAFATRGVPAQFTDIFTSLQAGQSPMTVFLQQGGQLKDMFGGIGPAAKAMGGYIMGLINPYTLAAGAVVGLGMAWYKGSQEAHEYTKAIILSGNAAGVTVAQLQAQAQNIAKKTGATVGASAEALTALTRNGNIAVANFEKLGATAVNMQKLTGAAVEDTVKQFSELGKAPLAASLKLNESTHFLTTSIYEQIKALEDQGKTLQAGVTAQQAYADAMDSRMPKLKENLGVIETAWKRISSGAKSAWDAMLNIGRADADPGLALKARLAYLQDPKNNQGTYGLDPRVGQEIKDLQEKIKYYDHIAASDRDRATWLAEQNKQFEAQQAFDQESDKHLTKAAQLKKEIAQLDEKYSKVDHTAANAAAYAVSLEAIKKQYQDFSPGKEALIKLIDNLEQQQTEIVKAGKRSEDELKAQFERKLLSTRDYYQAVEAAAIAANTRNIQLVAAERAASQAASIDPKEKAAAEAKYNQELKTLGEARVDIYQKTARDIAAIGIKETLAAEEAHGKYLQTMVNETDKINEQVKSVNAQTAEYGMSKDAIGALRAAELERQAATLEGMAIRALDKNLDEAQYNIWMAQAKAKRDLAAADAALGKRQILVDTAKEAAAEWKRTAEQINSTVTDALMRAFEDGKGFAVALRDTVVNMFKTMVLRPLVNVIMSPVSMGVSGLLGSAGAAASATSAGSVGSGLLGSLSLMSGNIGAGIAEGFATAWGSGGGLMASLNMGTGMMGAGSMAGGAGALIGALGPIALGIAAVYTLLNQDHGTPTASTGNANTWYDPTGKQTRTETYFGGTSPTTEKMVANMEAAYLAGAKALGITAASTMFGYGGNTGKDGVNPNFAISGAAGGVGFTTGETPYSEAAVQLAASRAVFAALQGSDLPGYLAKVFNGLTADTMSQDAIINTLAFAGSLKQVREALLETRQPLQILKDNVAAGFATLATSADTFKRDFVAAIDAGVSPANLAAWQALATTMDQLTAATEAANVALATSKSAVLGASEKVSSVLRAIGNDVKSFADAATTAHDNLVGARLNISEALWAAQDRVIELQRQAADGLRTFAASIDDFLNTINPAATSSSASLAMLKAQLSTTALLASGGDTGAQGRLISQAQAVLKAAEASSTDRVQYARSEAFVRSTLASVKKAVDPAPIVDAVAVAIVDPMATAKAALKAAQDAVIAYTLLAQTTGAETDRSTRLVAGSVADLAKTYGAALVANTEAQANYAEALRVTTGLQLTMSGSFDAVIKDLADLSTANSTFSTSIATFVADSKTAGLNITTSLGLTGTAATTLAGHLDAPGTAATTLATLLGDPKGNMDALVKSLGLTGTAATSFKTALTNFDPGKLIGDQLGLAGTALTNFAALVKSIRITAPTVTAPMTAASITTTGGALAGVQTVSMPDAVAALVTAQTSAPDASAAQIVNAANVNLGVSATNMALVGTAAGNTDIVAAANYANTNIVAIGGLIGSAQSITVATLQSVLTELSPRFTAEQLITAAQTNWGVSEADVRAVGRSLSLPGYAAGTNFMQSDGPIFAHAGEEITPRPYVDMQRAARDETNDLLRRLVASNAELKAEVQALKKSNEAGTKAAEKTAETLITVTRGGRAVQTEAFT